MKTNTLIDEREEVDLLENYQGKWKLLAFLRDGKSYLGMGTYDTGGEALSEAENQENERNGRPDFFLSLVDHDKIPAPRYTYRNKDISRIIQIPFKGE